MAETKLYQTKNGITLIDGFYLAKNPRSKYVNVISVYKGVVYIHDVTRKTNLEDLIHLDSIGFLEVFESLKNNKEIKEKKKPKET